MADHHPESEMTPAEAPRRAPPVMEEPLDPAQQSLADALRASFWVLKWVMALAMVVFLGSGLFIVDEQKEAVVRLRFGQESGVFTKGAHWAWPYPIDQTIRVPTAPKTMKLDAFWLNIREQDQGKDLSELGSFEGGLDPARDGALLTGDRAIMHLLLLVQYRITAPELFVRNVLWEESKKKDETELLRLVLGNAAVASAARTTADLLWKDPRPVVAAIQGRAQEALDAMQTGIRLENVAADKSYFPLPVKDAVLRVSQAEQEQNEAIQKARTQREESLNAAAGEAWEALRDAIAKLDQVSDGPEREAVIAGIDDILVNQASGQAGTMIKEAQQTMQQTVLETRARVREFELLLSEYQRKPRLFRERELRNALRDLYAQSGVTTWALPPGAKQIVLWLNKDPKQLKEAEETRMKPKAEQGKK